MPNYDLRKRVLSTIYEDVSFKACLNQRKEILRNREKPPTASINFHCNRGFIEPEIYNKTSFSYYSDYLRYT